MYNEMIVYYINNNSLILYQTEAIYALGMNALNETEKGREEEKAMNWLLRDVVLYH